MLLQGVLACAMSAASHLVHGSSQSSHCGRAGKIEPIQTPAVADVSGDVDSSLIRSLHSFFEKDQRRHALRGDSGR